MSKLLLIIDMQEGFRTVESEKIVPEILKIKENFDGKVVFAKFIDKKDSLFEKQLNWAMFQNKDNQKIFKELDLEDNIEIEHYGYTVLNQELKDFIKKNNIIKIYLAGVYTDVCIIKTAMDLFDYGVETFILEKACASLHGQENHNCAIDSLKYILGESKII